MEKEINEPTKDDLQKKIRELEHIYAELLADRADVNTLNRIWTEIQLLRTALLARGNWWQAALLCLPKIGPSLGQALE